MLAAVGGTAAVFGGRRQPVSRAVFGSEALGPGGVAVWWWGVDRVGRSGDRDGAVVLVELEDVAGEVDERPFAAGGVDAAAAEAPDLAVVLVVAEDGFDQLGALFVGGVALGGAQEVFHLLGRCEAGWRGAVAVSEFAGGASLLSVLGCGDQPVGAGAGEIGL